MEIWRVVWSGKSHAAWNMALDEALLLSTPAADRPILRFYGWAEPAASFGYFQTYDEIARLTPLRPLVRRPTGGGLVPHADDWTYAIVIPAGHAWHRMRAEASYERLHRWLQRAFAQVGVETSLAAAPRTEGPGQCFVGAEKNDLLHGGRKIAGAAQRRTRHGLLIQGSVQPPPDGILRKAWETALCRTAESNWGIVWQTCAIDERTATTARHLTTTKYALPAFNRDRRHAPAPCAPRESS